jgi:hypothetical protein
MTIDSLGRHETDRDIIYPPAGVSPCPL